MMGQLIGDILRSIQLRLLLDHPSQAVASQHPVDRQAEMIVRLKQAHAGFLYSTSGGGADVKRNRGMPSPALVEADDYVLIHGNGLRPAGVEAAIVAIRAMPAWRAKKSGSTSPQPPNSAPQRVAKSRKPPTA